MNPSRSTILHVGPKLSGYPTTTAARATVVQNPGVGFLRSSLMPKFYLERRGDGKIGFSDWDSPSTRKTPPAGADGVRSRAAESAVVLKAPPAATSGGIRSRRAEVSTTRAVIKSGAN